MSLIDQAGEVKKGEALNSEILDAYLKSNIKNLTGKLNIHQFSGGASNLTYLMSYANKTFILRRPPFGKIAKSAHDMIREAKIMQALKPVYPDIPDILHIHTPSATINYDFYVMECVSGIIPRRNFPEELTLTKKQTTQLCTNVIDKLIELHQIDYQTAGLQHLGKGDGYVVRQITGWSKRYQQALTPDAATFEQVITWLNNNMPDDMATCVIHNDFRLDNVVLNPENPVEVIGVLDWEMATLGDPLMDLGNSLAYWVQADDAPLLQDFRRQPTHVEGMLTRDEVIAYYLKNINIKHKILKEKTLTVADFDFYQIYGLFRLAAIIQQLYYRYSHAKAQGQTPDPRFADFVTVGKFLEQRCLNMINKKHET